MHCEEISGLGCGLQIIRGQPLGTHTHVSLPELRHLRPDVPKRISDRLRKE